MSWEQIASGSLLDAASIGQYDDCLAEGQRGQLEIDLRMTPTGQMVDELRDRLIAAGVEDCQVSTGSPMLRISYRKGFPWLAVIVAAVLAMVVLAILVVGWRFYREVAQDLGPAGGSMLLAAAIGVTVLGVMALRRLR